MIENPADITKSLKYQCVIAYYSEMAYSKCTANGSDIIEYT